jgi:hypothetical protein
MTIAFALFFQYKVASSIVLNEGWIWKSYRAIPGMGKTVYHAWKDPYCQRYENEALQVQCAGNAGVYRPTSLATLFFVVSAIATKLVPALNREAWLAKYTVFLFGIFFTMLIPNAPLFIGVFLWFARFGATIFVVLQQVILIDVAYNWNEDWVEKSNECDRLSYGSGQKWLRAIVATCVGMYSLAIIGISLLYRFFDGCSENTAVITLTLIGIVAMTAIQLSGNEGSLLTSSVMSVYATYLAFSIVSKNPNAMCNPRLGHSDVWGIVIGMTLTFLSLAWTGWSWSAEQRLTVERCDCCCAASPRYFFSFAKIDSHALLLVLAIVCKLQRQWHPHRPPPTRRRSIWTFPFWTPTNNPGPALSWMRREPPLALARTYGNSM